MKLFTLFVFGLVLGASSQDNPPEDDSATPFYSSFDEDGIWLRGFLHLHGPGGQPSLGEFTYEQILDYLKERGFDFAVICEHDNLVRFSPEVLDKARQYGIELFAASEDRFDQAHILHVPEFPELSVIQHPNWPMGDYDEDDDFTPFEAFFGNDQLGRALRASFGFEVYNGYTHNYFPGYERRFALAEDKWDALLNAGLRMYAISDEDAFLQLNDTHYQHAETNYQVVRVSKSATNVRREIVSSLLSGRFYTTTGLEIEDLEIAENHLYLSSKDAEMISVRQDGETVQVVNGNELIFDIPNGNFRYVRVTVSKQSDENGPIQRAWVQPLFASIQSEFPWNQALVPSNQSLVPEIQPLFPMFQL